MEGRTLAKAARFKIGLEARLFLIVFVVAAAISGLLVGSIYNEEKQGAEKALADELSGAA